MYTINLMSIIVLNKLVLDILCLILFNFKEGFPKYFNLRKFMTLLRNNK
jgi:hypothetical protein